ncbi:hypothetical protein ACQY0O_001141 [Thecaphora frezii]
MPASAAASASYAPAAAATPKPRRGANLLRDYYGLSSPNPSGDTSAPSISAAPPDPTNPDNHAFNRDAALSALLATSSLSQLLATESKLITEIRELDGERQSLVYNHHHQLVAASDTIHNMKQKSESLDPSLDALKASFSKMSQLDTELESLRSPFAPDPQLTDSSTTAAKALAMLPDLDPIVMLPTTLRDLIEFAPSPSDPAQAESRNAEAQATQGLAQAERLWGQMESVLSAWSDAGVEGVRDIMAECRSVLKEGRRAAGASTTASL